MTDLVLRWQMKTHAKQTIRRVAFPIEPSSYTGTHGKRATLLLMARDIANDENATTLLTILTFSHVTVMYFERQLKL